MKRRFRGVFGKAMQRYLTLHRSLGALLKNAEYALDEFDRYCTIHHRGAATLRRPMVVGYLKTLIHLHPATQSDRITHLRQFARYLFQFDPAVYIPERGLTPPVTTTRQPYIYSEAQIRQLIKQARTLRPARSLVPHTYATIIGLLWVSGLRIGEVVRLTVEDVDLRAGILHIRQTKFGKSRLVPLSPSAIQALSLYQERRIQAVGKAGAQAPFFVNRDGDPCTKSTTGKTLQGLIRKQGWRTAQGQFPHVHDIRHSFATHTLASFYRAGKDPGALLPVLATFLGHSHIANTQVYLHPSLALLREAGQRWHRHIGRNGGAP